MKGGEEKMKHIVTIIICLALILGIAGSVQAQAKKEIHIGVITLQMRSPYFISMVRAIEAEAPQFKNVKLTVADGRGDVAKVSADIEDLIAKRVDGFIMNISPLESLPGPMAAVQKAGIPVMLLNRKLRGDPYTSWIGADNLATATGVGEYIVKRLGGKGVLLMMRGGPEDNSTGNARRDGVLSKVRGTDIQVIIAPAFGGWTEDGGFKVMEDMLAKHKKIDAVFCENDSMGLGAMKAIRDAGRSKEILVFGFDGQKEALRQILIGSNYAGTGHNDANTIGRMGFHRLMAILAGATVDKDTPFPVRVINKDNVAKFYDPDSIF